MFAILVIVPVCEAVFGVANSAYNIIDTSYFVATDSGHTYKCYTITDTIRDDEDEVISNPIAIGWFQSADNIVPDTLTIPAQVTYKESVYNVCAIAKGGFRHCEFSKVNLPQSVRDIREEAFAFCMNLTEFTFPHGVTEIAPSTFLDCRNLTSIYYTNEAGAKVLGNHTIKRIGDHAFDSCVSLRNFYCPSTATFFGQSSFQKCESMLSFYFPSDNGQVGEARNLITVEEYAFADCKLLETVYFETNMSEIKNYAFFNCKTTLKFYYTGSGVPSFSAKWRNIYLTTSKTDLYDVISDQSQILQNDSYPGLIYTIETAAVPLDSAKGQTTINLIESGQEYISIYKFEAPFGDQEGYYDVDDGILIIPNMIDGKYVKVIKENTFANDLELKHVVFNEDLVQIQHHAFYACTQIHTLDFSRCTKLKEIGYEVFAKIILDETKSADKDKDHLGADVQIYNEVCSSIVIPSCVEYLGDFAFYNFIGLSQLSFAQPSSIKMIGDYAFAVHSLKTYTPAGYIDLELPNTLDDSVVATANYKHTFNPWSTYRNGANKYYSIGRYVFDNADWLRSVKMQPATAAQISAGQTTSFASNVFVRCDNLLRFETNENFLYLGNDCFKDDIGLKEVFLHSERAEASGTKFPWGLSDDANLASANNNSSYNETPFSGSKVKPDTVIYVSGSKAPGDLDNPSKYKNEANLWNSDKTPTFDNQLEYSSSAGNTYNNNKSRNPTFYNINWESSGSVIYWKPKNNTFKGLDPNNASDTEIHLKTADDYKGGYISLVKDANTGKYTVAKYFTSGSGNNVSNEVDLTSIPSTPYGDIANNITVIGDNSFAGESKNVGLYFILPTSVTTISERAFYRKNNNGVRVVTYKDGGTVVTPTNETRTYAQVKAANNTGYCCLPESVNRIEVCAFYNNQFTRIKLDGELSFLGNSAFLTYYNLGQVTELEFTNNSNFTVSTDGGIYYTGNASRKTLVYQISGVSSTLTVEAGTKAIGMRAVAKSKYTSVVLPDGLVQIYGGAFQGSNAITSVTGAGINDLTYISALPKNASDEIYTSSLPFDNQDFRNYGGTSAKPKIGARFGAFKDCSALATFDFTDLTSVIKIGYAAFQSCTALNNMTNGVTYTFNSGTYSSPTQLHSASTGVIDLRGCTHLRSISGVSFTGCTNIKYALLPNLSASNTVESPFYFGKDPDYADNTGKVFENNVKILIGEVQNQADYNYSSLNGKNHYPSGSFGNANNIYYRIYSDGCTTAAQVISTYALSGNTDANYWTYDTELGAFFLFENQAQVRSYYQSKGLPAS